MAVDIVPPPAWYPVLADGNTLPPEPVGDYDRRPDRDHWLWLIIGVWIGWSAVDLVFTALKSRGLREPHTSA